ncbi:MAG: DUF2189 domain-containing protein [Pseudomonadota bacterium]
MVKTIGNPLTWTAGAVGSAGTYLADTTGRIGGKAAAAPPVIRDMTTDDIRIALRKGLDDFMALRSDVIFMCLLYPLIGLCLSLFTFNAHLAPYLFPMASGFALIGPIGAVGLYEMSRLREAGRPAGWGDAFALLRSPAIGPLVVMGLYLLLIFAMWMLCARLIYTGTMGAEAPASVGAFLTDVFTTPQGRAMVLLGIPAGALFALLVLTVSVVSIPMLVDRDVGLPTAVATSLKVSRRNPKVIGLWGLIVAAGLLLGSIPLFLGLVIVMPVLGHASWHLYRRAVEPIPQPD